MRYLPLVLLASLLIVGIASATSYEYATPGTVYWVCPVGVTNITLLLGGAGGSGHGGWTSGGSYLPGSGGEAGDFTTISRLSVTPGVNYTLVVGTAGATAAYGANGNAGTYSSAFGYYKAGGAGGTALTSGTAGGTGETGFVNSTRYAVNGTAHSPYALGVSGTGYSAGGGGGSSDNIDQNTQGGAGSVGFVGIWVYGDYPGNVPDFSASPLTGIGGTLVTFTDLSTITTGAGLSYNWSFGDGTYSSTPGSVSHVYEYVGSYTVTLTLTSGTSDSISEVKEAYVNLVNEPTELDLKTEPKAVQFHVQTFWGEPLDGATVSVQGITTSTGNWDWVVTLLGIPLDEVALNGTAMSQTTDSLGNAEFLMIPSAKYNVSTTLSGYGFPLFYVSPHDDRYMIIANINGSGWFGAPTGTSNISVTVSGTKLNSTHGTINLTYYDEAASTTGGSIYVYQDNTTPGGDKVLVETFPITGNSFINNTTVDLSKWGTTFTVSTNATSSLESDYVELDSIVSFIGDPVALGYFDETMLLWMSMAIIILTALFAGATASPQISGIICIEAWIFYGIGWLNPLVDKSGNGTVFGIIALATFLAVLWNIGEGRRAER